ncbi:MAG: teicoplanin resistance protein VanZ [Desulfotalea sp.]|nr:MAG: teicoplanin resistance protein VanZ [Desulfotalea sp.]
MSSSFYNALKLVPVIAVMGIIFFLSQMPGSEIDLPGFAHSDLVAHMIIYATLGATILYAWSDRLKNNTPLKIVLSTIIVCFLYGVSDEFHQSFVPGRCVSAMDICADIVGAMVACVVWWFVCKKSYVNK